jgi:hypothetical protein
MWRVNDSVTQLEPIVIKKIKEKKNIDRSSNMITNIQLNMLRNQAFGKLKRGTPDTDLNTFSLEEQGRIQEIISDIECKYHSKGFQTVGYKGVLEQIYRDIRIYGYKKYDCLAMWLDPIGGLAAHEPELIARIAIDVGGLKLEE